MITSALLLFTLQIWGWPTHAPLDSRPRIVSAALLAGIVAAIDGLGTLPFLVLLLFPRPTHPTTTTA